MGPYSHFWLSIACTVLSSLQKTCHHFIWTQLFHPLAPSVMTFLFQSKQKSHSTFSTVGWKLSSSRGMSCHQLIHFCHIFLLYLNLCLGEKTLLSFLILNLACPSTQLWSHTLLPGHSGLPDFHATTHIHFFFNGGGELIRILELAKMNNIMVILSKHGAFNFQVNIKNSKITEQHRIS